MAPGRPSPSAPRTTPTTCGTRARGLGPCRSPPVRPGRNATWCGPCCSPRATTMPTPSFAGRSVASSRTSRRPTRGWPSRASPPLASTTRRGCRATTSAPPMSSRAWRRCSSPTASSPRCWTSRAPPRSVPATCPISSAGRATATSERSRAASPTRPRLSYVFTAELPAVEGVEGGPRRITGAMLLMPDYETLDPAVASAVESAVAASAPVTVIAAGTPYARVEAPWGDRADLVAVGRSIGCRVGQRLRRGIRLGG